MSDLLVVTGASSDIGVALIRDLLHRPTYAETIVLAHSFVGLERITALQQEFGNTRILSVTADLSQRQEVEALAAHAFSLGPPRAFVHLPALRPLNERFTKLDWTRYAADMMIQVESAAILLQSWLPAMAKRPGSRVVFLLSSYTLGVPPKFMAGYIIAKYAQLGLMRALAAEYVSSQVRINAIAPSMVETQFLQNIADLVVQSAAASNPLGRNATTEDLLGAFELLLSPKSNYIHGISLPVTAGTAM